MTVEQTPLDHFHVPEPKDHDSALRWLKEITHVEDLHILNEALEASKKELGMYDMDQAVAFVIQESDKKIDQQRPPVLANMLVPVVNRDQSVMPKLEVPAIKHQQTDATDAVADLTRESENNDIQKAIALSLQEQHGVFGGQVTTEEQDISRVLEASLADSKAVGTKRKRGEVWQDPLNPHERQRNGDWPVGLKNVGNTCWFAAVIQSLFHLPAFRHLVLNFTLLKGSEGDNDNSPRPHSFLFMKELRKLFALMLGTERKYVDPTQAIEVVREAFPHSASTDNQQDVSEFSHKLIEWLEDAYKLNSAEHGDGGNSNPNPMTKLFYGRLKSEGLNADYSSSHEAKFGQYPLQMNGFSEIHESLESAVVAQEIESCSSGSASKFGQETWFTQLPPVLVFELSRFHFNQLLGVPEKIHNRFEFPEVIYMDRYLERNKQVTRTKRDLVRKLKDDRGKLFTSLEKYMNYGSGSKRVPLQDVLQYVLEFVETKPEAKTEIPKSPTPHQEDIEMTSLHPASCGETSQPHPSSSVQVPQHETNPCPRHITEADLNFFQNCLNRWRREVESDVKALQESISRADNTIREIYNEPSLQQVPYRLHAVLVHEGQAVSGHYWAYVYSRQRETWLKLNDITVTEATWTDLLKESMGGHHNASAYCLMYVDEGSDTLFQGDSSTSIKELEEDIEQYVSSDNQSFAKEKETWLAEMSHKKDSSTMTSDSIKYSGDAGSSTLFSFPSPNLEHSALALKRAQAQIDLFLTDHDSFKLPLLLNRGISDLRDMAKHSPESKVESVGVYFLLNHVHEEYLVLVILEQLVHPSLLETFNEQKLVITIRNKLMEVLVMRMQQLSGPAKQLYQEWHERFSRFRRVIRSFVAGMDKFQLQNYEEAMYYLVDAFTLNSQLITRETERQQGFDANIIGYYRRKCVLYLNEKAVQLFQKEDELENVITLVDDYILPAMSFLSSSSASKMDSEAVVQVRDSWCSMLAFHFSEEKHHFLGEILHKLCDSQKEAPVGRLCVCLNITDLHLKFKHTMQLIKSNGDLQLIQDQDMK